MTHAFIPTQPVSRPRPTPDPELDRLERAVSAAQVWLVESWVAG